MNLINGKIVLIGLLLSFIGTIYAAPIYDPEFEQFADVITQILGGI